MMKPQSKHTPDAAPGTARAPYVAPRIERVDLLLEETLSAGCKLEGVCYDPVDAENTFEPGS